MAIKSLYPCIGLTGGGQNDLDGINHLDADGEGTALADNDAAIVIVSSGLAYSYTYDAASVAAESSPTTIQPDSNAGPGRWLLAANVSNLAAILDAGTAAAADTGLTGGDVLQVDQAETSVATATSITIGAASLNNLLTGTADISTINGVAGITTHCRVDSGPFDLVHSAGISCLQTGASITTAAGDTFDVYHVTSATAQIRNYVRASGEALVESSATAFHTDQPAEISALTEKPTPVAADVLLGEDSADGFSKIKVPSSAYEKRISLNFLDYVDNTVITHDSIRDKSNTADLSSQFVAFMTALTTSTAKHKKGVLPAFGEILIASYGFDTENELPLTSNAIDGIELDMQGCTIKLGDNIAVDAWLTSQSMIRFFCDDANAVTCSDIWIHNGSFDCNCRGNATQTSPTVFTVRYPFVPAGGPGSCGGLGSCICNTGVKGMRLSDLKFIDFSMTTVPFNSYAYNATSGELKSTLGDLEIERCYLLPAPDGTTKYSRNQNIIDKTFTDAGGSTKTVDSITVGHNSGYDVYQYISYEFENLSATNFQVTRKIIAFATTDYETSPSELEDTVITPAGGLAIADYVSSWFDFHDAANFDIPSVVTGTAIDVAGTGGTDGAAIVTGTTGTGTPFQCNVTISGGEITAVGSMVTGGAYTVDPTDVLHEPVTGGGLTGAQLSLTLVNDKAESVFIKNVISHGINNTTGAPRVKFTESTGHQVGDIWHFAWADCKCNPGDIHGGKNGRTAGYRVSVKDLTLGDGVGGLGMKNWTEARVDDVKYEGVGNASVWFVAVQDVDIRDSRLGGQENATEVRNCGKLRINNCEYSGSSYSAIYINNDLYDLESIDITNTSFIEPVQMDVVDDTTGATGSAISITNTQAAISRINISHNSIKDTGGFMTHGVSGTGVSTAGSITLMDNDISGHSVDKYSSELEPFHNVSDLQRITGVSDVILQKIIANALQTSDVCQVLQSDGTTKIFQLDVNGNVTVKGTFRQKRSASAVSGTWDMAESNSGQSVILAGGATVANLPNNPTAGTHVILYRAGSSAIIRSSGNPSHPDYDGDGIDNIAVPFGNGTLATEYTIPNLYDSITLEYLGNTWGVSAYSFQALPNTRINGTLGVTGVSTLGVVNASGKVTGAGIKSSTNQWRSSSDDLWGTSSNTNFTFNGEVTIGANKLIISSTNVTASGTQLNYTIVAPGTLTASKALVVDASKKIDDLLVDNLELNGNTLSSTDANGDINLTPNGTGKVVTGGDLKVNGNDIIDSADNTVLSFDGNGNVTAVKYFGFLRPNPAVISTANQSPTVSESGKAYLLQNCNLALPTASSPYGHFFTATKYTGTVQISSSSVDIYMGGGAAAVASVTLADTGDSATFLNQAGAWICAAKNF